MTDLLVKLYDLPDSKEQVEQLAQMGIYIHRGDGPHGVCLCNHWRCRSKGFFRKVCGGYAHTRLNAGDLQAFPSTASTWKNLLLTVI